MPRLPGPRAQRGPRRPPGPRGPRRSRRPPRWLSVRRGDPGRRVGIALLAITIVLTVFAGRLVQLQGMESGYYHKLALREKLTPITLPAVRGAIYGSNGQALAMTVETFTITADPTQIPPAELPAVGRQLAGVLGMPAAQIVHLLTHPSSPKYVVLASGVSVANEAKIAALAITGIYESAVYSRAYPDGNATANVVGFTHVVQQPGQQTGVIVGVAGIEEEYNKLLTGTPGSEKAEFGADGEPIPLAGTADTPAKNGKSIRLTINPDLQYQAEQACRQRVRQVHAKQCTVVIMQPKTGDILAMAQWPTYSQSAVTNLALTADLPVQAVFAPGSTAKVVTAAAAFEHGGQTPMSAYTVPPVIYRGGQWIHDAEQHPVEHWTIAGIIANSSNIGMSEVVGHVPPQIQYEYLRNFGLGRPTGLGLPGASPGILAPPSKWAPDERYTLSFGQGIAVNAVQMASVYATIANDGVRVQPRLVAGTYNAAGQYKAAAPSPSRRVIKAKTARQLISILQQVPLVDQGANEPWGIINGYAVASKTGTSQESSPSCPASNPLCIFSSSYIGMAPGNDPQVVVAVNVQDPNQKYGYYGDVVAGPVFYSVMKSALQALRIPPQPGLQPPNVRLNAP